MDLNLVLSLICCQRWRKSARRCQQHFLFEPVRGGLLQIFRSGHMTAQVHTDNSRSQDLSLHNQTDARKNHTSRLACCVHDFGLQPGLQAKGSEEPVSKLSIPMAFQHAG